MIKKIKSFTLLEITIVIVILAIIIGLALPQYIKVMERSRERDAVTNLFAIQAAMKVYFEATRDALDETNSSQHYPLGEEGEDVTLDIAGINNLKLNIIENNIKYVCDSKQKEYSCRAYFPSGEEDNAKWKIGITQNKTPYCLTENCPTCTSTSCPRMN